MLENLSELMLMSTLPLLQSLREERKGRLCDDSDKNTDW